MAAIGAALGGAAMYGWSARSPLEARRTVAAVPAISESMITAAEADIRHHGWLVAALEGPMTSTPYKVYAMLAPAEGVSLPAFVAAAVPVRLPRFLFVALFFAGLRRLATGRIKTPGLWAGFTGGWLAFYVMFWASHPG
ncbi:MAG: hypothetical protein Q8L66_02030 [Caulobacter sp.]|nr:hypothetical protein [Caulobacter sp.]